MGWGEGVSCLHGSVMYHVLVTPITPNPAKTMGPYTKARWMPLFSFYTWFPLMAHPFQRLVSQPQAGWMGL